MYQTATVAEWYKQHGKHAVYANPRKPVPLPAAQPIALTIPRDGVLVPAGTPKTRPSGEAPAVLPGETATVASRHAISIARGHLNGASSDFR